ncbi:MAG: hypothetical protein J2O39_09635, partial [Acidimicrobiales bacterium]|nr:hypothetical protein [Acidimicrobiales bacterium]
MAFGGKRCPSDRVVRTFVVKVMSTPAQKARAFALLEDAGDAWAWVIDRQNRAWREHRKADNDASALWKDQKAHGPFGLCSATSAQDVILSWQRSFFEASRRRRAGDQTARYPMSKRRYQPVVWRRGK